MTTTPDFRALCEQLMELAEGKRYDGTDVVAKARAALATSPPEPPTHCITFCAPPLEEVIRIDKEGFHYKGQFIADAGEAHRLMLAFLKQHANVVMYARTTLDDPKVELEPPTDDDRWPHL
jgi:hypothetical protein